MEYRLKVAVVVVTHNRDKDCRETIKSLLMNSELPDEIIVVDGASSTPFKFEHELVHILRYEQDIGLSASRNAGIRASSADIIAFIDDDALATKDWIKTIQGAFRKDIDIAGGPALPLYLATPPRWWDHSAFGWYIGVNNQNIIGCNFAIKKRLFSTRGYFNTQLGRKEGKLLSSEETELFQRASKSGAKVLFIPQMVVHHKVYPYRLTMQYLIRRAWWEGRSNFLRQPTTYRTVPRVIRNIIFNLLMLFLHPNYSRKLTLLIIQDLGYLFSIIGNI